MLSTYVDVVVVVVVTVVGDGVTVVCSLCQQVRRFPFCPCSRLTLTVTGVSIHEHNVETTASASATRIENSEAWGSAGLGVGLVGGGLFFGVGVGEVVCLFNFFFIGGMVVVDTTVDVDPRAVLVDVTVDGGK